jgi:hypothetical protein
VGQIEEFQAQAGDFSDNDETNLVALHQARNSDEKQQKYEDISDLDDHQVKYAEKYSNNPIASYTFTKNAHFLPTTQKSLPKDLDRDEDELQDIDDD